MPKHHIDLLMTLAAYVGALLVIIGITGATLVHYVPSILPVYAVLLAFLSSIVIVGALTWAVVKSDEYPERSLSPSNGELT
jgi:hypothetical protein